MTSQACCLHHCAPFSRSFSSLSGLSCSSITVSKTKIEFWYETRICFDSAMLTLHTISFRLTGTVLPDLDQVKVLLCCTAEPNHGSRNMQAVNSSTLPLKQGTVSSKSPMCPEATYTYYKHSTLFYPYVQRRCMVKWKNPQRDSNWWSVPRKSLFKFTLLAKSRTEGFSA